MDFHLGTRNSWKRWLTRQILRNAHLVICNSSVLAREVSQFDQYLVPVVVRPTLPKAMERLLDIPRVISTLSPIRLLTVGRLVQRKNHEIIIRALSDLPEVVHTVIGRGPEEAKIRARAEELGVSGRLRLLTECSDDEVVQEWAGADIFVFLPRSTKEDVEGFGIVYLEAAAAGLPIIASDEEAIGEALDPEGSVRLSSTDPTSLVAAINMLALDPVKRQKMGEANRDFVKKNFLATRIKDELARYVL
jgi:phosphatidylinositol alpha-1,6-mannosyltransferase